MTENSQQPMTNQIVAADSLTCELRMADEQKMNQFPIVLHSLMAIFLSFCFH